MKVFVQLQIILFFLQKLWQHFELKCVKCRVVTIYSASVVHEMHQYVLLVLWDVLVWHTVRHWSDRRKKRGVKISFSLPNSSSNNKQLRPGCRLLSATYTTLFSVQYEFLASFELKIHSLISSWGDKESVQGAITRLFNLLCCGWNIFSVLLVNAAAWEVSAVAPWQIYVP